MNLAKVSGLLLFVVSQKIGWLLVHPHYNRLHGCALDLLPDLRNQAPNLLLNQPATNSLLRFCTRQWHRVFGSCSHKLTRIRTQTTYNVMSCKWEACQYCTSQLYNWSAGRPANQVWWKLWTQLERLLTGIRRVCSRCIASEECDKILIYDLSVLQ